jgi:Uma2 family endonuclease
MAAGTRPNRIAKAEIPPLVAGDRLTSDEFARRYEAMPHVSKAELIDGVVYMPSPVSADDHGEPHFDFSGVLFTYRASTPGVRGGDNSTLHLDLDNQPQPDVYLRIEADCGGQSRLVAGYIEGAPELVVEVAASSASYDLHDKLNAYRRNGVREYVVWRVWDQQIDWFELKAGRFEPQSPDEHGIFRSRIMPGLWLDGPAVVAGNLSQVLQTLHVGLASGEHAAFVEQLAKARNTI